MKSILIPFFVLGLFGQMISQDRPKEIQVRVGLGLAGYKTDIAYGYDDGNFKLEFDTTDGAVTRHIPLEIRYDFTPVINAGIDFKFGSYLYASDDQGINKSNTFTTVGIGTDINIYQNSGARVFLGLGAHSCRLQTNETKISGINPYTETITWRGPGFSLKLGTLYFFGDSPFGIQLNLGYDRHAFELKTIEHSGLSQDLTNFYGNLVVSGIELNAGIIVRLRP